MKKYKILTFFVTFILTLFLLSPTTNNVIPYFTLTTTPTTSDSPFSFYSINAYKNKNSKYEYEENVIYYQVQETANEPFDDLNISIEDTVLEDTVFQEYNAIIFLENIDYTYKLHSITNDDNDILNISLEYYANTETTEYLHGGMILIPKWYQFKDIKFSIYNNNNSQNQLVIKNHSNTYIPDNTKYYSPIKISSNLIEKYSMQKYETLYYFKITDIETLKKLIYDFDLEVTLYDLEKYESIFSYRNLIIVYNDDTYFYCSPKTSLDKNYNNLWNTEKLQLDVTVSPKEKTTQFAYLTFNFIPKKVNCDTIEFNYEEKRIDNYNNNEILITKNDALKIAKNYFDSNSEIKSFIGLYDQNYMGFAYYNTLFPEKIFQNMWSLSGKKNSYYRTIYLDATTGEIKIEM